MECERPSVAPASLWGSRDAALYCHGGPGLASSQVPGCSGLCHFLPPRSRIEGSRLPFLSLQVTESCT